MTVHHKVCNHPLHYVNELPTLPIVLTTNCVKVVIARCQIREEQIKEDWSEAYLVPESVRLRPLHVIVVC